MKMENAWRQACRGTLRVVAGANTYKAVSRFFDVDSVKGKKLLEPSALIRMMERKCETQDERTLLVLLSATKTGELKKFRCCPWRFRGFEFFTLRGDVPRGVYARLTLEEIRRDNIPRPD